MRSPKLRRLFSEPLVHFLALGAFLFAVWGLVHRGSPATGERIELAPGDLAQLRAQWELQQQRPPTPEELKGLVDARLREELFARRARELGLDRDDVVIRRRLAQKLEFVTEDLAVRRQPTDAELEAFFAAHRDRYALPARVSFRQIYFSSARRGERASADAREALERLRRDASSADELGDPSLFDADGGETTLEAVRRTFGPAFADALRDAELDTWRGPVRSEYGWHLARVESRTLAREPALSEVREQVVRDWSDGVRREANEEAYQSLLARYEIVVADPLVEVARVNR